jgi:hypothetical protein
MKYVMLGLFCTLATSAYAAATPEHKAELKKIDADYAQVTKTCKDARMPKARTDACIKDAKAVRTEALAQEKVVEAGRKHLEAMDAKVKASAGLPPTK